MNTVDFGKKGELLAAEYLELQSYKILRKNWRFGKLEVDIIAETEDFIVIVEVKMRSTDDYGDPWEFVGKKKQSNLVKAAQQFVDYNNIVKEVRFDIISIIINERDNSYEIEQIEDAFNPLIGM